MVSAGLCATLQLLDSVDAGAQQAPQLPDHLKEAFTRTLGELNLDKALASAAARDMWLPPPIDPIPDHAARFITPTSMTESVTSCRRMIPFPHLCHWIDGISISITILMLGSLILGRRHSYTA